MDLLKKYYEERHENRSVYIDPEERGFATYWIFEDECYIEDLYVIPEARLSGVASELGDAVCEIAKNHGCKYMTGTVVPSTNGSTGSLKCLLAYGMKLHSCTNDKIVLIKEFK